MKYITAGREPQRALEYFEEISAIPRGSYHEEAIAEYLLDFAKKRGLWAHKDPWNNVYIRKPAFPGYEHTQPILLQGHIDMVCVKDEGIVHDFEKDPIPLYIDKNNIMRAHGTTLGTDDGFAVSYMLSILNDTNIIHPPLECLFTSMEEVGMCGAEKIDPALIRARRMIGMDACPEGYFMVSAAGGCFAKIEKAVTYEPTSRRQYAVTIKGLLGGHSGLDIDKERGNANKLCGRILYALLQNDIDFGLCHMTGGSKENVIPSTCTAVIDLQQDQASHAEDIIRKIAAEIQYELAVSDPQCAIDITPTSCSTVMDRRSTVDCIHLLYLLPNGPRAKSSTLDNLVLLSLNMGKTETTESSFSASYMLRSGSISLLHALAEEVVLLSKTLGATCQISGESGVWEYSVNSTFRPALMRMYKEFSGNDGILNAVHGGLEPCVISSIIPDMDIVGFGPDQGDFHTTKEWLDLDSYRRVYEYLIYALERLAIEDV